MFCFVLFFFSPSHLHNKTDNIFVLSITELRMHHISNNSLEAFDITCSRRIVIKTERNNTRRDASGREKRGRLGSSRLNTRLDPNFPRLFHSYRPVYNRASFYLLKVLYLRYIYGRSRILLEFKRLALKLMSKFCNFLFSFVCSTDWHQSVTFSRQGRTCGAVRTFGGEWSVTWPHH